MGGGVEPRALHALQVLSHSVKPCKTPSPHPPPPLGLFEIRFLYIGLAVLELST